MDRGADSGECTRSAEETAVMTNESPQSDVHQNRPRVLHVVTSALSTRLMRGQLRYLQEHGYDAFLACADGPDLESFRESEGITAFPIAMERDISPFRDLLSLVRLYTLIRRIRPAVTNVGTPKAGLIGSVAAWLARVPYRVYTLRGLRWETASGIKRRILMLADQVACACSHQVICVSHNLRSAVIHAGLTTAQRAVVLGDGSSNGVDQERFAPTKDRVLKAAELRKQYGILADAQVVGFVGRFTRDKGIAELYEAHKLLQLEFPALRLVLVGDFEPGDPVREELRLRIKSDSSVVTPGFLTDASEWYHVFDVLALPSHREGFPNVILEAQAAGKPVVGALATGVADAIFDGVNGFLVPIGDAAELAKSIGNLIRHPMLRTKMGKVARKRAVEKFAPQRIWEALAAQYATALRERGLMSNTGVARETALAIADAEQLL
jgi:glycosyltransferase involved in cell wall biosynthesis